MDLLDLVYNCPFCRAQRTMIGLLGLLLLLPNLRFWLVRYLSAIFAVFGLVVGSVQHFRGWARINSGEFEWGEQWYVNSWMLSGFAILIITALVMLNLVGAQRRLISMQTSHKRGRKRFASGPFFVSLPK